MAAPQFKWTEECKRDIEILRKRVELAPRVACRPDELLSDKLSDGWCIVVKTDACNTGAGACLLLVKCANAKDVTEEMLADPTRVKLISTLSKVLSADEKKWLTFEQEPYGMYLALRKWGSFLMQATINYPDMCLVGLFMDSLAEYAKTSISTEHIDKNSALRKKLENPLEGMSNKQVTHTDMQLLVETVVKPNPLLPNTQLKDLKDPKNFKPFVKSLSALVDKQANMGTSNAFQITQTGIKKDKGIYTIISLLNCSDLNGRKG